MRSRKSTTRKLLSLSAFGAGAAVFGTGEAYATIHYTAFPANTNVGFQQGGGTSAPSFVQLFTAANATINHFSHLFGFKTKAGSVNNPGGTTTHRHSLLFNSGLALSKRVTFAVNGVARLQIFNYGQTWNAKAGTRQTGFVNYLHWSQTPVHNKFSATDGSGDVNNLYALFRFDTDGSGDVDYGWIQYSLSISPDNPGQPADGPNMTLVGFAYDDTGAAIAAGNTGAVPEPSTFDLSGLSALMLGAAGVRRWREARRKLSA